MRDNRQTVQEAAAQALGPIVPRLHSCRCHQEIIGVRAESCGAVSRHEQQGDLRHVHEERRHRISTHVHHRGAVGRVEIFAGAIRDHQYIAVASYRAFHGQGRRLGVAISIPSREGIFVWAALIPQAPGRQAHCHEDRRLRISDCATQDQHVVRAYSPHLAARKGSWGRRAQVSQKHCQKHLRVHRHTQECKSVQANTHQRHSMNCLFTI